MAQFSTSTGADALKTFYAPRMNVLINRQSVLWMRLDKKAGTLNADGKSFTLGVHKGRNNQAGIGVSENGTIPAADYQKFSTTTVPLKFVYTPIELSGPVIKATKTDAGAFVRAIRSEVQGAVMDTKKSINRQINGDGRDALAFYVSGTGTGTARVDDGNGNVFTHLPGEAIDVDLIDASDHSTVLDAAVSLTLGAEQTDGYDAAYGSGTVDGSASAGTAGNRYNTADYYVRTGTLGKQLMGLTGIISNGNPPLANLQGVAASGNPWHQSQIVGSYSTMQDLRFPLFQRVISKIGMNSAYEETDVKFIHTSPYGRDKYFEVAANERRTVNEMKLDGGFTGLSYNGTIALIADPDAVIGRYNFIVPDALKIVRSMDFEWIDDGSGVLRKVSGKDAFEGVYGSYVNLATVARNGLGALLGINMS